MTFLDYLRRRRDSNTAAGDFVRDARADREFPGGDVTWPEVRSYMESKRAIPDAIAAAFIVWQSYKRTMQRRK